MASGFITSTCDSRSRQRGALYDNFGSNSANMSG
jgi:hypothetical protein